MHKIGRCAAITLVACIFLSGTEASAATIALDLEKGEYMLEGSHQYLGGDYSLSLGPLYSESGQWNNALGVQQTTEGPGSIVKAQIQASSNSLLMIESLWNYDGTDYEYDINALVSGRSRSFSGATALNIDFSIGTGPRMLDTNSWFEVVDETSGNQLFFVFLEDLGDIHWGWDEQRFSYEFLNLDPECKYYFNFQINQDTGGAMVDGETWDTFIYQIDATATVIPEPSAYLLLGTGLAGLAALKKTHSKRGKPTGTGK